MASSRLTLAHFLRHCHVPFNCMAWTKNHEKVSKMASCSCKLWLTLKLFSFLQPSRRVSLLLWNQWKFHMQFTFFSSHLNWKWNIFALIITFSRLAMSAHQVPINIHTQLWDFCNNIALWRKTRKIGTISAYWWCALHLWPWMISYMQQNYNFF
jgi:hypothetical protein